MSETSQIAHFILDFPSYFLFFELLTLFLIFLLIFFKLRSSALLRGSLAGTG